MTDIGVFRDKLEPDVWCVEVNDYNDDGGCTVTVFLTHNAAPYRVQRLRRAEC